MKIDRILNPGLIAQIAAIGHTEYLVIADAGLPIPKGPQVIDLSLVRGIPSFLQVLDAVNSELVSEGYILAGEMSTQNPDLHKQVQARMAGKTGRSVSHEAFKELTKSAKVVVRTGETTPDANIILVAGVNF